MSQESGVMNHQFKETSSKIITICGNQFNDDLFDQLIYRGEGNSSIVVALRNKSKVIRLLKKDGKLMRSSQDHHATQHPMRSIKFIHLIMKPLTAPFMSDATELAHLKSEFINMLSKKVEAERPSHRLDKTLYLDDQYALIMDDLCALPNKLTRHLCGSDFMGPTISIEIKPKQGFLPHVHRLVMKSSINDQMTARIKGNCLYGLTQYLKLTRGRIMEISEYCPINLFSGCPTRMKSALEALLEHPQNNLRIFKDLILAYDESNQPKMSELFDSFFTNDSISSDLLRNSAVVRSVDDKKERFIDLLIQCLLNEPSNNNNTEMSATKSKDNENQSSSCSNYDNCSQHSSVPKCKRCDMSPMKHKTDLTSSIHKLPQSCVLASVLRAQKLDSIGAFEACYMLEWLLEDAKTNKKNVDILEELSKPQMPPGFGSPCQLSFETKGEYYLRKVWEFLVSLTAKDCSIMITVRQISTEGANTFVRKRPDMRNHILKEDGTDNHYLFNVGIADFDQKMPLKIPRICDNLKQIVTQTQFYENSKKGLSTNRKVIVGPS